MAKKKTTARYSDAASIVGAEIAADLEAKSQQLIGRSGLVVNPSAIVLKEAANFPPGQNQDQEEKPEDEGMATGTAEEKPVEEEVVEESIYGGAKTLGEAEAFLVRENGEGILLGDWGILAGVLTNIAGAEHGEAVGKELKEFQTKVDVMAIKALADLRKRQEEYVADEKVENGQATGTVSEEDEVVRAAEAHSLDGVILALRESIEEALATPVDQTSRLKMVQPALNKLGDAIKVRVSGETPALAGADAPAGITQEQLSQAVAAAVAPLMAELQALKTRTVADEKRPRIPAPRGARYVAGDARLSYDGPVPGETRRMAGEVEAASALAGFDWRQPGVIDPRSESGPGTETPKLSAMIRRSVGLRN